MTRSRRASLFTVPRFAAVAILAFGVLFVVLTPPLAGFDESAHLLRAYEVSDGRLIPHRSGDRVGSGVFPARLDVELQSITADLLLPGRDRTTFIGRITDPAPTGRPTQVRIGAIAGYNPAPYLPAAIAIRFGRLFGASTVLLVYLARFATLLTYTAIVTLAVARARRARWLLSVAALLPAAMVGATTVTVDGITYALILLLLAMAVRSWSPTDRWRRTDTMATVGAALVLGLAKPPYALFALLVMPRVMASKGIRRVGYTITALLPIGCMVAWSKWMERPLSAQDPPFGSIPGNDRFHPYTHVNSTSQLNHHVLGDPLGYLKVLGSTVFHYGAGWLRDAPAQLKIDNPSTIGVATLAWCALLVGAFVSKGAFDGFDGIASTGAVPMTAGEHPARLRRLGVTLLCVVVGIATLTGAYISWNAVGSPRVYAYQGRYLLAVCAVLALAVVPARALDRPNRVGVGAAALVAIALGWYLALVVANFY